MSGHVCRLRFHWDWPYPLTPNPNPHRLTPRLHRRVDGALDQVWVPASGLGFCGRYFPALALSLLLSDNPGGLNRAIS